MHIYIAHICMINYQEETQSSFVFTEYGEQLTLNDKGTISLHVPVGAIEEDTLFTCKWTCDVLWLQIKSEYKFKSHSVLL